MLSTVTVSTITNISMIADLGLTSVVSVVIGTVLIAFFITKELTSVSLSSRAQLIAKFLDIGVVPISLVLAVIVAISIAEILG